MPRRPGIQLPSSSAGPCTGRCLVSSKPGIEQIEVASCRSTRDWFELPFAALVVAGAENAPVYLMSAIRSKLSPVHPCGPRDPGGGGGRRFRWRGRRNLQHGGWRAGKDESARLGDGRKPGMLGWPGKTAAAAPLGLSRLAGSGPEWRLRAGMEEFLILLEGRNATKENVRRAFENQPSGGAFRDACLATAGELGGRYDRPELVGYGRRSVAGFVEMGGWNADADLIVLSGCTSAAGAARLARG